MSDQNMDPKGEYDDMVKQMCWEFAWYGYRWGYGVEDMEPVDYRASRTRFERQWNARMDQ